MKSKRQHVLMNGDWDAAWLLSGLQDPLKQREFAGDEDEMAAVAAYLTAMGALKKKMAVAQPHLQQPSLSDDEDGLEKPPGPRKSKTERRAEAKAKAKAKAKAEADRKEKEKDKTKEDR